MSFRKKDKKCTKNKSKMSVAVDFQSDVMLLHYPDLSLLQVSIKKGMTERFKAQLPYLQQMCMSLENCIFLNKIQVLNPDSLL